MAARETRARWIGIAPLRGFGYSGVMNRALALFAPALLAAAAPASSPRADIVTSDADRFYAMYDATGGRPDAGRVQRDYLDKATPGLAEFAQMRGITAERIVAAIAENPKMFAEARQCVAVLPAVKRRLARALGHLARIYPAAVFPPVTILVGRGKTGGTANRRAVMIGLETLCSYDFLDLGREDRFVYITAHEYVHVQQPAAQVEDPNDSVLKASLIEGAAEFIDELISGSVAYTHLHRLNRGREREIETAFVADMDKVALKSDWLYNQKLPLERRDLGYWVGYRIAKAYYRNAPDKRAAVAEIIGMTDPKAFLARSGWTPGMTL